MGTSSQSWTSKQNEKPQASHQRDQRPPPQPELPSPLDSPDSATATAGNFSSRACLGSQAQVAGRGLCQRITLLQQEKSPSRRADTLAVHVASPCSGVTQCADVYRCAMAHRCWGHCRDRQGDLRSGEQMSRALIDTTTSQTPGLGCAVRRH